MPEGETTKVRARGLSLYSYVHTYAHAWLHVLSKVCAVVSSFGGGFVLSGCGVVYMKEKGLSLLLQLLDDMVGLLDPELMPTSSEAEVVCVCVCVCVCCTVDSFPCCPL